jgi:hypothetical protein
MLKLAELALLGREVRQDGWADLGTATPEAIVQALEEGRVEDAASLARYLTAEGKGLHALMCDWVWDLPTCIAERIGLVNEIVPEGRVLAGAQELAHQIAALPQGAIRSDKETALRGVGRTLEERLRIEAEMTISMFMRRGSHTLGATAFKAGNLRPIWPSHGL